MFSVPGKYSGGEGNGFSWTQTLQEVSVRAPLPAGTPDGVVRCSFAARRIEMSWEGLECPLPADELNAVIVVDDSLWVVEKDGAEAAVILTLQKAVPTIWDRLFTSAAALPTAPPTLLDAPERTAAPTKQELLRQAKERLGDELDGPSRAKPHVLEGLVDEQRTLSFGMDGLPELPVIIVRGCKGCTFTLAPELALIKVQIEHCKQCSIDVQSRVLTETIEVWECEGTSVRLGNKSSTVQLDKVSELKLTYAKASFFDRIMHTGARKAAIAFEDAPELATAIDFDALQAERPEMTLDDSTDQFITRRISGASELSTELVIRLCNDFPTTEREVREFEQRTRMHADKLDEVVDGMLGSSLGRSLSEAEREQMKTMLKEQSAAASETQKQAEQTPEGRHAARVEFKKKEGNEAFKGGNYQQAAVFYTEALGLDSKQHTLFSNRAACFLKLGRYQQAHEDALECTRLAPTFAKGHFRLALALQAEDKPGEACASFNKVLDLEPSNKEAASGLNMARMQAERQRRQQAGQV